MRNKLSWLLAGAVLVAAPLCAEVKILKNFTLIDGTGKAPVTAAAMIIDNGRISWVGTTAQLKAPAGADVVDLAGKFVIPGIINLHGHLGAVVDLTQSADNLTEANLEKNLKTYAAYGVTSVLSMGTDKDFVLAARDKQRLGRPGETRIFSAGDGFVFAGGYGGLAGVNQLTKTPGEVDAKVAKLASQKVDTVKLWLDDHNGEFKKMPYDIVKAITDAGHKYKMLVSAHIFYLEDAKKLTDFGVNGFAHMVRDQPIDQALIDSMKKHGTWQLAATLSREASMFAYAKAPSFISDPFFTRGVSENVVKTLKSSEYQKAQAADPHFAHYPEYLENAKKNIKKLVDSGVKYGFGTDSGPPGRFPGFFEHWEMELLVEAGLTPSQVIQSATKNAAEYLKAKDLGTLEKSKWADLLVLEKNPLENIKNTQTIDSVYIAGNRVK
ncbi:MAG TPA: amidohydrolase family protein [Bryobacteraceae bacterium]|nr:amidohydrolase family protein [Bryobacteraceae bacterium]